jgi:hypothetical protein
MLSEPKLLFIYIHFLPTFQADDDEDTIGMEEAAAAAQKTSTVKKPPQVTRNAGKGRTKKPKRSVESDTD